AGKAAAALHRLLVRRGEAAEAAQALRSFVRGATDEDTRAELLRSELDVDEYLGRLEDFERLLVALPGRTAAERKLSLALLERVVPPLYARAATDPAAAAALARLSRWGLRPLVELATEREAEPDPVAVEILGLLGSRNATPVLLRLAEGKGRGGNGTRPASSA